MIDVAVCSSAGSLDDLQVVWNALWLATPNASVVSTLDGYRAWFSGPGRGAEPAVLMVSRRGRPLGILPLAWSPAARIWGDRRQWQVPSDEAGLTAGPLGEHPTVTLLAAARFLAARRAGGDRFEWGSLPAGSGLAERGSTTFLQVGFESTTAPLPADWEVDLPDHEGFAAPALADNCRWLRHRPRGAVWNDDHPAWPLLAGVAALSPYTRQRYLAAVKHGLADVAILQAAGTTVGYAVSLREGDAWRVVDWQAVDPTWESNFWAHWSVDGVARGDRTVVLPAAVATPNPWLDRAVRRPRVRLIARRRRAFNLAGRWRPTRPATPATTSAG